MFVLQKACEGNNECDYYQFDNFNEICILYDGLSGIDHCEFFSGAFEPSYDTCSNDFKS